MKKIVIIILICTSLLLSSCFSIKKITSQETTDETTVQSSVTDTNGTSQTSTADSPSASTVPIASTRPPNEDGLLGDYLVKYIRYELTSDYENNPAIALYFQFTNNSKETLSFSWTIMQQAFQDGIELDWAYYNGSNEAFENSSKDIKPGVTIDVCSVFILRNTDSDIELEMFEYSSDYEEWLGETIVIAEGRTEPTATSANPAPLNNLGTYFVEFTRYEVVKDFENNDAVAVYFNFTNNSAGSDNFLWAITSLAFQNGVELASTYTIQDIPEYNNCSRDIKPGVTIGVCMIYLLHNSTADVNLEVYEFFTSEEQKLTETLKIQ